MAHLDALADELYREEVKRARSMNVAEKFLEGPRLFHRAWQLMADGIRHVHPDLDEADVQRLLAARLSRLADVERR
jgi:hypothetical protein